MERYILFRHILDALPKEIIFHVVIDALFPSFKSASRSTVITYSHRGTKQMLIVSPDNNLHEVIVEEGKILKDNIVLDKVSHISTDICGDHWIVGTHGGMLYYSTILGWMFEATRKLTVRYRSWSNFAHTLMWDGSIYDFNIVKCYYDVSKCKTKLYDIKDIYVTKSEDKRMLLYVHNGDSVYRFHEGEEPVRLKIDEEVIGTCFTSRDSDYFYFYIKTGIFYCKRRKSEVQRHDFSLPEGEIIMDFSYQSHVLTNKRNVYMVSSPVEQTNALPFLNVESKERTPILTNVDGIISEYPYPLYFRGKELHVLYPS